MRKHAVTLNATYASTCLTHLYMRNSDDAIVTTVTYSIRHTTNGNAVVLNISALATPLGHSFISPQHKKKKKKKTQNQNL